MARITTKELEELAVKAGLGIQHDCGGYRVVGLRDGGANRYLFPDSGICPTATKQECATFLKGWIDGRIAFASMF